MTFLFCFTNDNAVLKLMSCINKCILLACKNAFQIIWKNYPIFIQEHRFSVWEHDFIPFQTDLFSLRSHFLLALGCLLAFFQNVCLNSKITCLCSHLFCLHTKLSLAFKYVLCALRSEVCALWSEVCVLKSNVLTLRTRNPLKLRSLLRLKAVPPCS